MHSIGWFGGGWLMMTFTWILILGITYLVVKAVTGHATNTVPPDSATEILKRRYARGEISKEEFKSMTNDLT